VPWDKADVPDAGDVAALRAQFPALTRRVHGGAPGTPGVPLVYLDTASTAQKPRVVVEAVTRALEASANVHRGLHALSVEATEAYEAVRAKAARLVGAGDPREIVFTRGATEAINLVAARTPLAPGDEVLVTELEHHSNLVPWQMRCAATGARLRVLPIDDRGEPVMGALDALLSERTRVVAVAHASNSLGTVLPVAAIAARAKAAGALVVVDGAQAVAHLPVDVRALGCDFYAFSGHKLYGPPGTGVLWGRHALLDAMPPWQGGGDMVLEVTLERATYREPPHRFEAGTPNIAGVIGLGAAIDWFLALGAARVAEHDAALVRHALRALSPVPGLRFVGRPAERIGVVSFLVGDIHPHDLGTALDLEGIAIRTGHHCTQPVMDRFGIAATARASFGVYTTEEEIDRLAAALGRAYDLLSGSGSSGGG
jgi:cysteine desulfurase/selenocysteine lyase